jgi:hypothetical protein
MSTRLRNNTEHEQPEPSGRKHSRRNARIVAVTAVLGLITALAVGLSVRNTHAHAASINCVSNPSGCGFPDASNTGVPAGTKLLKVPSQISSGPGWHYDTRGWVVVDGNGAVVSGLYIPFNLNITASNVTIKNVQVVSGGQSAFGVTLRHTTNVTIEDSTISGVDAGSNRLLAGVKDVNGDAAGTTVLRNNISLAENGVQLEAGLVKDNYIHDPGFIAGDHTNGIMSNGGNPAQLTITHNTVLISRSQTDAVALFEDFGVQANRVISNNLLAGGGYSIYGGQTGSQPTTNIAITGNSISNIYYPNGGAYGPIAYFNSAGSGNTWSGNIWDSSGLTIPAPK